MDATLGEPPGRSAGRPLQLVVREGNVAGDQRRAGTACEQRLGQAAPSKVSTGGAIVEGNLAVRSQVYRPRRRHALVHLPASRSLAPSIFLDHVRAGSHGTAING